VSEGVSSWYGKEFHGRPTASGERFDMNGLSAAHRTLALGTRARITNLENGRAVDLVINDRGPFIRGRILDCSYGSAKALGFAGAGLARVRIEVLEEGRERPRRSPPPGEVLVAPGAHTETVLDGSYTVQAGAFASETNAQRFRDQLSKAFGDAYVIKFRDLYRVRLGHLATEDEAEALHTRIQKSGIESFVTRND
jgi:rare lipoprotein A